MPDKRVPHSDRRSLSGRRDYDSMPKTTLTRKGFVIIVALVDALYLVSDAFLVGHSSCL